MALRIGIMEWGTGVLGFSLVNPGVMQKQWRKVVRVAIRMTLNAIWRYILPKKFAGRARGQYPGVYFVRKRRTQQRKYKRYGHSEPLINYRLGQPPPDKRTTENYLAIPPSIQGSDLRATARWASPNLQEVYKKEVTAFNAADLRLITRYLHRAVVDLCSGGLSDTGWVQWTSRGPRPRVLHDDFRAQIAGLNRIHRARII